MEGDDLDRRKINILYKDVLGEVDRVIDRAQLLRKELPAAADSLAEKLELLTGNYLAAGKQLADVLMGMSQEIDRQAATAAQQASEAVKLDIRQAAAAAASQAISQAVGDEVKAVIGQINQAGRIIRWSFAKVVAVVVGGAVLGGLVAVLGIHYLPVGGGAGPQLSAEDRMAIENGQKIQRVWNSLTDKERAHIQQLAGQK